MPEGHVVHRQAKVINKNFGGSEVIVDSPQGRFSDSAALISGSTLTRARAYGKHLFITFDRHQIVHIHLGLYGKWTFTTELPEPKGLIRLRFIGNSTFAELRGPNACALITPAEAKNIRARIGPDPIRRDDPTPTRDRVLASSTPIGTLLMDQKLFAGVGNIYRAEVLFRHNLNPMSPGQSMHPETFDQMWEDLCVLMKDGVRTGRIDTVKPEHSPRKMKRAARQDRHGGEVYVYRRDGRECFLCGTTIEITSLQGRNLFWCPRCQA